jgi:hypothetical protein
MPLEPQDLDDATGRMYGHGADENRNAGVPSPIGHVAAASPKELAAAKVSFESTALASIFLRLTFIASRSQGSRHSCQEVCRPQVQTRLGTRNLVGFGMIQIHSVPL